MIEDNYEYDNENNDSSDNKDNYYDDDDDNGDAISLFRYISP